VLWAVGLLFAQRVAKRNSFLQRGFVAYATVGNIARSIETESMPLTDDGAERKID